MKFQNPSMHGSYDIACIRFHCDFFKGGITPEREITRTRKKKTKKKKKKTCLSYFSMRNPDMKFQSPSMHGSCRTERTTRNQSAPSTSSTCAHSEDSEQPRHPTSFIRIFALHYTGS